jgi:transcriptional regulator with XRE-family HTH domain
MLQTKQTYNKKIGDRIREIRETENLTQEEFAHELGVKRGYISTLETHRNEPSEQLVLNISRTFTISYDWLKKGIGKKYQEFQLTSRGRSILKEIIKAVESPERKFSLRDLAEVVGVNLKTPLGKSNLPESFYWALSLLIRIFREENPGKIEAVLAQLKAFMPGITEKKLMKHLNKINRKDRPQKPRIRKISLKPHGKNDDGKIETK